MRIKMCVQLPTYLDNLIFNELGCIYQTRNNVDNNLYNNERKNKIYIGTYFPRSFAESYKIFSDLFSNQHITERYRNTGEMNILDIGAGTGGNLLGTLHALRDSFPDIKNLNVYTIEGNELATSYLRTIVSKFNEFNNCNVHINSVHQVYSITNFEQESINVLYPFGDIKFDIIMSFKFFSEFYNREPILANGLYQKFIKICDRYLKARGLAVLLDVTTTDRERRRVFTPIIMNKEISNCIRSNNTAIKFLLPLSCANWNHSCRCNSEPCYTQKIFEVSHSRVIRNKSKVCYAVLVKSEFANLILSDLITSDSYIICYKSNGITTAEESCHMGMHIRGVYNETDAFKLNQ